MRIKKCLHFLGAVFCLLCGSAFIITPITTKITSPTHFNLFLKMNTQEENPHPDWERIISDAFRGLNYNAEDVIWEQTDEHYYSAAVFDHLIENQTLRLAISTMSAFEYYYGITTPSDSTIDTQDIPFHGLTAQLISETRYNKVESYEIQWYENGLFHNAKIMSMNFSGSIEQVNAAADALYYASGGSDGPIAPIVEEPEELPFPKPDCMDRSCEETGCEDGVFYTLQAGILDLESNTCIINSPEISTFGCGYQGGDTEFYDCDYETNTCAYGFMVVCELGCNETTGRCLQYIEDDPDNIIFPPEPLDDCDGGCPYAICQGETSYYGSPECRDGICYYEISEYCPLGCNTSTGYCLKGSVERESDVDQLLLLLGVAGGGSALIGGGLLGGGLLGLRALRGGRILLRNPNPAPPIEMDPITKGLNQTRKRADELLEKLRATERQHLQDNLDHSVKMMESYHRSAENTETIELLPKAVGWAAGKAADYVGMIPAGKYFKYGYKFVTKTIEEGIEKGVGSGLLEGLKEVVSDAIGDKIGDLVKVKDVENIAEFSVKTSVKAALKETGVKTIGKNFIKDKAVGSGIKDVKGLYDSLFGEI
jgi:hypothetical protein